MVTTITLLAGLFILGFLAGLSCAIALVKAAGVDWREVMTLWRWRLIYRKHQAEIGLVIKRWETDGG